jgi:hypothetical protein
MSRDIQYGNTVLFDRSADLKYLYVGRAACGSQEDEPVWIIKRIEIGNSGNFVNLKYANCNILLGVKWSERTTLEYK